VKSILLFDIDNTLLKNTISHHRAFEIAFSRMYGVQSNVQAINPHGKTDLQIINEVLKQADLSDSEINTKLKNCLEIIIDLFMEMVKDESLTVIAGVRELIQSLFTDGYLLGLVTGNLEAIAWEKLRRAGLKGFFGFGGFGSDNSRRAELVGIALSRAQAVYGGNNNRPVILIGDTPLDIEAGKEAGVHTIGVATGKFNEEELRNSRADAVIGSFEPREAFYKILENITGT
jgi:phosphoglycolate phosphatase-like HAD superfamily hydrolase